MDEDDDDLEKDLDGKYASSLSTLSLLMDRSKGVSSCKMSSMALLITSDLTSVSRRRSNWSSTLTVNMMMIVLILTGDAWTQA